VETNPIITDLFDLREFFLALTKRQSFMAGPTVQELAHELGTEVPRILDGCLLFRVPRCGAELTQTHCYMACRDLPIVGWRCLMICVTCTTQFGGGCSITIY